MQRLCGGLECLRILPGAVWQDMGADHQEAPTVPSGPVRRLGMSSPHPRVTGVMFWEAICTEAWRAPLSGVSPQPSPWANLINCLVLQCFHQ